LRRLTRRCTSCGQKLRPKQTTIERLEEINNKGNQLAKRLGRLPQVHSCENCHRIVFEGESGFVQSYLLIDMDLGKYPKKQTAQHRLSHRRSSLSAASPSKK
jgi:hypothetical protein